MKNNRVETGFIFVVIILLMGAFIIPSITGYNDNSFKDIFPGRLIEQTVENRLFSNNAWLEQDKLIASDGGDSDNFGSAVSLSGDYAIIGVYRDDDSGNDSGSAYVFKRTDTNWIQQAKLTASDGADSDIFGFSVSIDGDYAVVGAPYDDDAHGEDSGSAYIFARSGTTWSQQVKILSSDNAADDQFGYCVSINGDYAVIGAPKNDGNAEDSGSVYVFKRTDTNWIQQAKLTASDGANSDFFGNSVSFDGAYAIFGAMGDNDNGEASGSAYVFKREDTTWIQQAKLLPSDGEGMDLFGYSVSIDREYAVIGAHFDSDYGLFSGSAYVFKREDTTWTQQAKLLPPDGDGMDLFGTSVSIEGTTAVIGSVYDDDNGFDSGSVYVYTNTDTTWTLQEKLLASDGADSDHFGASVSIDGYSIIIGASLDDCNAENSGSAYVFIPKISQEIKGGLGINVVITNNGDEDAFEIPVEITVQGGIFGMINKSISQTVDISAGESKIIRSGVILGLGSIVISTSVADIKRTTTGTQLLIFTMVN